MNMPTKPLKDRIAEIRAEIDAFIDAKAEQLKAEIPNVPLQVHRNDITRHSECQCRVFLTMTGELR
jgi:hypothetical protein